jgi:hypothetical protein
MIVAKSVIDNKFWILTDDDKKIGNIQAAADGYFVRINDKTVTYKTLSSLKKQANIHFDSSDRSKINDGLVYGYNPGGKAYNAIFDVKRQLPLFTRTKKSKSWYAAGWYKIKQHNHWITAENPKLITLQRYAYQGPFPKEPA